MHDIICSMHAIGLPLFCTWCWIASLLECFCKLTIIQPQLSQPMPVKLLGLTLAKSCTILKLWQQPLWMSPSGWFYSCRVLCIQDCAGLILGAELRWATSCWPVELVSWHSKGVTTPNHPIKPVVMFANVWHCLTMSYTENTYIQPVLSVKQSLDQSWIHVHEKSFGTLIILHGQTSGCTHDTLYKLLRQLLACCCLLLEDSNHTVAKLINKGSA